MNSSCGRGKVKTIIWIRRSGYRNMQYDQRSKGCCTVLQQIQYAAQNSSDSEIQKIYHMEKFVQIFERCAHLVWQGTGISLKKNKAKEHISTSMNKPILKELIKFPEPLNIATKNLDISKPPTINLVIHTFKAIKPHCVYDSNREHTDTIQLKIIVTNLLNNKFKINYFHVLGSILDSIQTHKI